MGGWGDSRRRVAARAEVRGRGSLAAATMAGVVEGELAGDQ